jgi:alkylresorcinol/alkylpyrone synthase/polyketide synthase Type III
MRDDLIITNISSMGCEAGGMPGLKRAADFTKATGKPSMVVATELSSLTHFPEPDGPDPENGYELLRANAVFGDASSAALIGVDSEVEHPYILDSLVYTKPEYREKLGYTWRDGRLRVRLSKDVPQCAAEVSMEAVGRMFARHYLECSEIKHWIVHGAGMAVLDRIQEGLGLPEDALKWSRQVLNQVGNVSSATVGITGKFLMEDGTPKKGDLGVIVTVGPGMSGGCSLLRWGE